MNLPDFLVSTLIFVLWLGIPHKRGLAVYNPQQAPSQTTFEMGV